MSDRKFLKSFSGLLGALVALTVVLFIVAKGLQAVGIADVAYGLYVGMFRDDMWTELYMTLAGLVGRFGTKA